MGLCLGVNVCVFPCVLGSVSVKKSVVNSSLQRVVFLRLVMEKGSGCPVELR